MLNDEQQLQPSYSMQQTENASQPAAPGIDQASEEDSTKLFVGQIPKDVRYFVFVCQSEVEIYIYKIKLCTNIYTIDG